MGREICGFVGGRIVVLIEFSMELCLDDVLRRITCTHSELVPICTPANGTGCIY
jgi:hypothetical protein